MGMEADKSRVLLSASWKTRKASGVIQLSSHPLVKLAHKINHHSGQRGPCSTNIRDFCSDC